MTDRMTGARTFGFLFGTYMLEKVAKKEISEIKSTKQGSIREYGRADGMTDNSIR